MQLEIVAKMTGEAELVPIGIPLDCVGIRAEAATGDTGLPGVLITFLKDDRGRVRSFLEGNVGSLISVVVGEEVLAVSVVYEGMWERFVLPETDLRTSIDHVLEMFTAPVD